MDDLTRRRALKLASAGMAISVTGSMAAAQEKDPPQDSQEHSEADVEPKTDRDFVLAAGMTEGEADCWAAAAECAAAFFKLPEVHSMDTHEIAHAIHVIQNKLLSRPTYRQYLKNAKNAKGE